MSINDKISIIVPVYNLEKYIERTLTSICNQTYSNIEVIVVDDGSIDNSYGVICEYAKKDSRVVLIHQENGGENLFGRKKRSISCPCQTIG